MKYKGVRLKFHKIFFFALTVNHANRTVFDVFEKLFLSAYKQLLPQTVLNSKIPFTFLMTLIPKSWRSAPKILSKNLFTITRTFIARNIDAGQNFSKIKKTATIRRKPNDMFVQPCLTVTVTRLFRPFFGLGLCPTTSAGFFPQSEKYIPP